MIEATSEAAYSRGSVRNSEPSGDLIDRGVRFRPVLSNTCVTNEGRTDRSHASCVEAKQDSIVVGESIESGGDIEGGREG